VANVNPKKPKDIRSKAADLIYKASWPHSITPESVIVELTQQTEQDILWAIEEFEKELFSNRIAKMNPQKEESIKRSVVLDAVLFSLRYVKEKVAEKYKIQDNS